LFCQIRQGNTFSLAAKTSLPYDTNWGKKARIKNASSQFTIPPLPQTHTEGLAGVPCFIILQQVP
jgi:hypothetical protein